MQVIINTDHNIILTENMIADMESLVDSSLAHFDSRLTRVDVHLTDGSAGRSTGDDIRCRIEANPEGLNTENVTENASTVDAAVSGALHKLKSALDTAFGRQDDQRKGRG